MLSPPDLGRILDVSDLKIILHSKGSTFSNEQLKLDPNFNMFAPFTKCYNPVKKLLLLAGIALSQLLCRGKKMLNELHV